MTEFEIIKTEISTIEQKYLKSAMDIISDYNNENKTKTDYKRRQIYELLQNADDCYSTEFPKISVRLELRDNILIVQNTGTPFSARGILSLMHTDASSKYEGTIGCKGLGFRSVLNWAKRITIYTKDFFVDFSEERAIQKLQYYKHLSNAYGVDELNKIHRTAILTAAEVFNDKGEIDKWLEPNYSTSIVLHCDETIIDEITNQLVNFKFEELLFLQHVNKIEIITNKNKREILAIKENNTCTIQESNYSSQWRIWNQEGNIILQNGNSKKYELIIAYNNDSVERERTRQNGFLYSFFKTDIPISFPFLIHGTFELTSERNSLVKDNLLNKIILDKLIDFIGQIGEELVHNSSKCDYEALRFLLPSSSLGQLDWEYNFTKKLKEKIKEYKVLPTINEEYISIKEYPKYSKIRFDSILLPSTCCTLLKHTDDNNIINYIKESNINFYSDLELVHLVNRDAQYYVDNNLHIEIICLYHECFRTSNYAPKLLTDSEGKLINEENTKIFINPTHKFSLPKWSKMYFLNFELEKSLSNRLYAQGRRLLDKLKNYNLIEYSFKMVLTELISQSNYDVEKIKETFVWLYEFWENNNRALPIEFENINLEIISRENSIVSICDCYIGKEYGNDLGERLTQLLEKPTYIGTPKQIGLIDKNIEDIKLFFKTLGIKLFPKIQTIILDFKNEREYIKYNSTKHPIIFDTNKEQFKHSDFFYKVSSEIQVSSIIGIDTILNYADFYDIICWIFQDSELYNAIININEISNKSIMYGLPYRAKYYREAKKDYMASWLRKLFTEYKWLPTKSNIKVNVENCTLYSHKLSPFIEVLDIDYTKLIQMSGKSKKEIDLLFEKLGIAEDIFDLSPTKIYEILIALYSNEIDYSITKQVYNKLNLKYKVETINSLIENNPIYDEFKKHGKVLAELNGKYSYLPTKNVYYVDKKIYSEDILKNYPLLALNKRSGATKIQKMFCVKPLKINIIQIKYNEHLLNIAYQNDFKKVLPYFYAKKISFDNKNKIFNTLRSAKIILVNDATTLYKIKDEEQLGTLQDFELIYKDKTAYIKIPLQIHTLNELKENVKFKSAVAEFVTTILDADGDKDSYLLILTCRTNKEIEEYFIENVDENLTSINLAKEKFLEQIDRKKEFWNAIERTIETNNINQENYNNIISNINFNDLNCYSNSSHIINLFKMIGIDIEDYNQFAFDTIDLRPYYIQELRNLKNKYREKYLTYLIINNNIKSKLEWEIDIQKFDELTLTAPNSVDVNIEKIFENNFDISIDTLNDINENYNDIINIYNEKLKNNSLTVSSQESSSTLNFEIDYAKLNSLIASNTNDESIKVDLSAFNNNTSNKNITKNRKKYDKNIIKSKEENGFIAESKVYHTLCSRIGAKGSVVWVSGNGQNANAIKNGDDSLGYDIWYTDASGKKHYVEVKASTSENIEFVLTKNELEFANEHKDEYEIWYVRIIDSQPSIPFELGNLLLFSGEETFFNNSKFSVENTEFKIRATAFERNDS